MRSVFFYLRELQKWNRKINLSGSDNDLFIIQQHFLDSLSCLLSAQIHPHLRLLDIGTGAGFPGIPLAIYEPNLRVTAVDAVAKKIVFLKHLCRMLPLSNVECFASRLPQGMLPIAAFDLIVSRAVGTIPLLLELAKPLLAPGGYILLQRGQLAQQELVEHAALFQQWNLTVVKVIDVHFDFLDHPRYLVVFQHSELIACPL